ncbi:MAG: RIP metalloprotease RseP [Candidatus Azobacteroides sp.]|nr:RIP metalloprotease RseP [Candidatus Azobacteroides sp.]
METFLIKALQLILSLSILVVVHELGHFLMVRLFKIRVEKFYLFFDAGFALFRYKPKKSHTEYGIGWLPLGGYVKIAGMIDESLDTDQMKKPAQPWEFRSKPAWQRLLVMVAGVVMNFLLALFIYSMVIFKWGDAYIPMNKTPLYFSEVSKKAGFQDKDIILAADGQRIERYDDVDIIRVIDAKEITVLRDGKEVSFTLPANFMNQVVATESVFADILPTVVDSLIPGYPAIEAGLQKGDSLVAINGTDAVPFTIFTSMLEQNKGKEVAVSFYRNDSLQTTNIIVNPEGKIGFTIRGGIQREVEHFTFMESFPAGIKYGVNKLSSYIRQMKLIFTKEGATSLGGFGTIGSIFPPIWDWRSFWLMTAFLSIILAFMNILPIPALDGGHVVFLLYEVITGRKPSERFLINAQYIGMLILISLLIFANGNDIYRFFFK